MKNFTIILLSVLFIVAVVLGIIFYRQNNINTQKLADAKENFHGIKQSEQGLKALLQQKDDSIDKLQNQLETSQAQILSLKDQSEQLMNLKNDQETKNKELNNANKRIIQLENEMQLKTRELADTKENLLNLNQSEQNLKALLQQKDDSIDKLQNQLEISQAQILSLENQTKQQKSDLLSLKIQFEDIREEKGNVEIKVEELQSTYNTLMNKLHENIKNQEAVIMEFEKKLSVTFLDRVLFGLGKTSITSEGKIILKSVGDILKNIDNRKIRVIGHTDNILIASEHQYKFPTNWELSSARAAAVVRFFQNENGLDPEKMECVGRSYYQPVASNKTDVERAKNRRVEIIIVPITKKVSFKNQ